MEEHRFHYGVYPHAEILFGGYFCSIDVVEFQLFRGDALFQACREDAVHIVEGPCRIEHECASGLNLFSDMECVYIGVLVAGEIIGTVD